MLPSEAMPTTTVTKITGPVTVLMSCKKASASHFAFLAASGATSPNTTPRTIATITQNQSCLTTLRSAPPRGAASPLAIPCLPRGTPRGASYPLRGGLLPLSGRRSATA